MCKPVEKGIESKQMYYVNYNNGMKPLSYNANLDEAKAIADAGVSLTEKDIMIENEYNYPVCVRKWIPLPFQAEDYNGETIGIPIVFGDYG